MLEKRGSVLDTAKVISHLLEKHKIAGAIIGGVAVVLHGHIRTTRDVDVLIQQPADEVGAILRREGLTFDAAHRQFLHEEVPVHLVPLKIFGPAPKQLAELEGIRTLSLADLINAKLRSGTSDVTRAQDLADVIGLIRHHRLGSAFASKIEPSLRPEFRKLVKAIRQRGR